MDSKDYYKILGVSQGASADEIKSAYRSLALKYHPDRVPESQKKSAEERFKEISAAYYVLSDPKRRKEYDDYRSGAYVFRGAKGPGDFASQAGFDFEDLMKHFHGLRGSGRSRQRANPYFSFDDLSELFGGMQDDDAGSGASYTGYHFDDQGYSAQQKIDTDARATLNIPRRIAQKGGEAKFKLNNGKTITLAIKPGTKNGQKLRLKDLGEVCPTCDHKGDLIITIHYA